MAPAVFLIGCHRSGTTLTRYLLDAHPRLACPPESKFIAAMEAFNRYPQAIAALESLGVTRPAVRREMRRLIESIMDDYAKRQGKQRWIDKTPNYYRILSFIDEIFDNEARYLFIARHPLDCAASLSGMYDARRSFADPEIARSVAARGRGTLAWCGYWDEVYRTLLAFRKSHPDRCFVFRYEDLVLDTRATLGAVLAYLGEETMEASATFPPAHAAGYGDADIRATDRVMTDRMGRWKAWPREDVDACWAAVAATAARLGYDVT